MHTAKDLKKCLKGKLHIIIICLRLRKIRELSKLPKNYINKKQLMAIKRNLTKFLKMKSDVVSLIDVGKLQKRTATENLKVLFPSVNLGFGR